MQVCQEDERLMSKIDEDLTEHVVRLLGKDSNPVTVRIAVDALGIQSLDLRIKIRIQEKKYE